MSEAIQIPKKLLRAVLAFAGDDSRAPFDQIRIAEGKLMATDGRVAVVVHLRDIGVDVKVDQSLAMRASTLRKRVSKMADPCLLEAEDHIPIQPLVERVIPKENNIKGPSVHVDPELLGHLVRLAKALRQKRMRIQTGESGLGPIRFDIGPSAYGVLMPMRLMLLV